MIGIVSDGLSSNLTSKYCLSIFWAKIHHSGGNGSNLLNHWMCALIQTVHWWLCLGEGQEPWSLMGWGSNCWNIKYRQRSNISSSLSALLHNVPANGGGLELDDPYGPCSPNHSMILSSWSCLLWRKLRCWDLKTIDGKERLVLRQRLEIKCSQQSGSSGLVQTLQTHRKNLKPGWSLSLLLNLRHRRWSCCPWATKRALSLSSSRQDSSSLEVWGNSN